MVSHSPGSGSAELLMRLFAGRGAEGSLLMSSVQIPVVVSTQLRLVKSHSAPAGHENRESAHMVALVSGEQPYNWPATAASSACSSCAKTQDSVGRHSPPRHRLLLLVLAEAAAQ